MLYKCIFGLGARKFGGEPVACPRFEEHLRC